MSVIRVTKNGETKVYIRNCLRDKLKYHYSINIERIVIPGIEYGYAKAAIAGPTKVIYKRVFKRYK